MNSERDVRRIQAHTHVDVMGVRAHRSTVRFLQWHATEAAFHANGRLDAKQRAGRTITKEDDLTEARPY